MIKGINLGGWLVTERWITPSLYGEALDEYELSSTLGGKQLLQRHYDTFIAAKDFAWIAEHGFDTVRLPVGHWTFGDVEPYNETITYVDHAFKWAEKYGLKILLDVHTAPGSQNGHDHSGKQGDILWHTDSARIEATVAFVSKIAERYGSSKQLWGIELLNEPDRHISHKTLENYYRRAYDAVRESCGEHVAVVVSDAYRPIAEWEDLLHEPAIKNMLLDMHLYQSFSDKDKQLSLEQHIAKTFSWQRKLDNFGPEKVIVGEWSVALDRTYDDLPAESKAPARDLYKQAQYFAFARTAGHFYWTYKTERPGEWSYRSHK